MGVRVEGLHDNDDNDASYCVCGGFATTYMACFWVFVFIMPLILDGIDALYTFAMGLSFGWFYSDLSM